MFSFVRPQPRWSRFRLPRTDETACAARAPPPVTTLPGCQGAALSTVDSPLWSDLKLASVDTLKEGTPLGDREDQHRAGWVLAVPDSDRVGGLRHFHTVAPRIGAGRLTPDGACWLYHRVSCSFAVAMISSLDLASLREVACMLSHTLSYASTSFGLSR